MKPIDYSKSQKKLIASLPPLTTKERSYNFDLARKIIDRNRELGKQMTINGMPHK